MPCPPDINKDFPVVKVIASSLRKGNVVDIDGRLYAILVVENIHPGKGIYTDMNAIRRDEELDNLHSVYVDQWDWEKVITPETRTLFTLHQAVTGIVSCICDTQLTVRGKYPQLCDTPLHL